MVINVEEQTNKSCSGKNARLRNREGSIWGHVVPRRIANYRRLCIVGGELLRMQSPNELMEEIRSLGSK